jgi:hypothetical protein
MNQSAIVKCAYYRTVWPLADVQRRPCRVRYPASRLRISAAGERERQDRKDCKNVCTHGKRIPHRVSSYPSMIIMRA